MTVGETVAAVIDALSDLRIPYMLTGAFAVNFFGAMRLTRDADFVVQMSGHSLPMLAERLAPGFELRAQAEFETITGTQKFVFARRDIAFIVELFLLSDDPHDQARFARRINLVAWSREVNIPTAEDLIITKLRWSRHGNRSKDLDDVRGIIEIQKSRLDWDYIERWCEQHGTKPILDQVRRGALDA